MKQLFLILRGLIQPLLFILSLQGFAQQSGIIFFEGSWEDILYQANVNNKYIYVDAYTTWCGPCKMMKNKIFPLPGVGQFYNENFICVALDMEAGSGIEFAKLYGVNSYPHFLYFDPFGKLVHRSGGYKPANDFIKDGLNALDPDKQFFALQKQFEDGNRETQFLYDYATALDYANLEDENVVNAYLILQKEEELLSEKNWEFIKMYLNNINSREFKYLLSNQSKFKEKYGEEEVNKKITGIATRSARIAGTKKDEVFIAQIKQIISDNSDVSKAGELILNVDIDYYYKTKEWTKFAEVASKYAEKYAMNNATLLNSICWDFYEKVEDTNMLKRSIKWIQKSIELENKYYNNDTYAAILYKLGEKKEGIAVAEKAIALAKAEGSDYSGTEGILNKIQAIP